MGKRRFFTLKNKRHMPTWLAVVFAFILKCIAKTYRLHIADPHGYLTPAHAQRHVFVLWHNRLLFMPALAPRRMLETCAVLISASRDGEYISTIVRYFGLTPVRGSSSRGGARALFQLCEAIDNGKSVILTVDGPRGPRYSVHPGAAAIAQKSNVSIVPASLNARHKWCMRSWDKMQIPWPFSRIDLVLGQELPAPESTSLEQCNEQIQLALMELTVD